MSNQNMQKGFTLIELVVVMVILAILAAVAIPQYMDLRQQARIASLNGLAGNINGAVDLVHSKYLALGLGTSPVTTASGTTVAVTATAGAVNEGLPTGAVGGIDNAITSTGYSMNASAGVATFIFGMSYFGWKRQGGDEWLVLRRMLLLAFLFTTLIAAGIFGHADSNVIILLMLIIWCEGARHVVGDGRVES